MVKGSSPEAIAADRRDLRLTPTFAPGVRISADPDALADGDLARVRCRRPHAGVIARQGQNRSAVDL